MDDFMRNAIGYLAVVGLTFIIYWIGKSHENKTLLQVVLFFIWAIVGGAIFYYMDIGSDY